MAGTAKTNMKQQKVLLARLQILALLTVLCLLIAVSATTFMMVIGVVEIPEEPTMVVDSFVDAHDVCDKVVREEYADTLRSLTSDSLSTRYDAKTGYYRMFYELDLYRNKVKNQGVYHYFVACAVSATGKVVNLDILRSDDDVERGPQRTNDGTNFIGL